MLAFRAVVGVSEIALEQNGGIKNARRSPLGDLNKEVTSAGTNQELPAFGDCIHNLASRRTACGCFQLEEQRVLPA